MDLLHALAFLAIVSPAAAIYAPLREYSGNTFFDAWDFWGNVDNTTWGNVTYLDKPTAMNQRLAYVDNTNGHAIIRVDNTTNIANAALVNRPSVRITSQDSYGVGNLIIIDVAHMPTGCSVWPSFWTLGTGKEWPHGGEIDIIEGINLMPRNQMAMHADPGCVQAPNPKQSGSTLNADCASADSSGCIVAENKPNSFGASFNKAGGGVFVTQLDVSGVFIWFWSRADIPQEIATATSSTNLDTATFGLPSASYPASGCDYTQFFGPQQLVLLTTLCGSWAGVPQWYSQSCPGTCISNVIGPGSPTYDEAYWDIAYLRTYLAQAQNSTSSATSSSLVTGNSLSASVSHADSVSTASTTPIAESNTSNTTQSQGNGAFSASETHMRRLSTIVGMISLVISLL